MYPDSNVDPHRPELNQNRAREPRGRGTLGQLAIQAPRLNLDSGAPPEFRRLPGYRARDSGSGLDSGSEWDDSGGGA